MTTATTEGRRLVLEVEGVDRAFTVDPLPASRGRALTDLFIRVSAQSATGDVRESIVAAIFIEAIGPINYARIESVIVDQFDGESGKWLAAYGPDGILTGIPGPDVSPDPGVRYAARAGSSIDGDPIRQEEGESLALCAFYWQTIIGMEGVRTFLDNGEGSAASLKVLNLLVFRLGLSPSPTLHNSALASLTTAAGIPDTSTPNGGGTREKLPWHKRDRRPKAKRG